MNDEQSLEQGPDQSWRTRTLAYRRDRVAQVSRLRQAAIRRLGRRSADIDDVMERVLEAWQSLDFRLPRVAQTLDLHYVAGLSIGETAEALGVPFKTSADDLRMGRAWLIRATNQDIVSLLSAAPEAGADPALLTGPH